MKTLALILWWAFWLLVFVHVVGWLDGCLPPTMQWHVSHAAPPANGQEQHTCLGGGTCPEGWACTRHGCEWCGPGETRCTAGNDDRR